MNRKNMKGLLWGGLAVLALTASSCDNKKGGAAGAAETTDSTAVETPAVNESAYDLEAIAKVIDGCEDLESFNCGLAAVKKNGKIGYINKMGNVVIPFEYDPPTQVFSDGVGTVFKGDDVIYMDTKGKELFRTQSFGRFYDGLCSNREQKTDGIGRIGFIDKTGKMVIAPQYDYTGEFSDGMCWVTTEKSGNKIGFINTKGELVVPCQYEWPSERQPTDFHEGLCAVMVDDVHEDFGFIDKTGKRAFPGVYSYESNFSEGLAAVTELLPDGSTQSGYIDKTGKMVIKMDHRGGDFHGGIAKVMDDPNPIYFIDKTGKKVFELDKQYKNVDHYGDGAWLVWDGEHMGYIDCTGKIIVPCKYYAYNPFSEGLAALQDKQNGKWGFVDKEGKSTFDYQ